MNNAKKSNRYGTLQLGSKLKTNNLVEYAKSKRTLNDSHNKSLDQQNGKIYFSNQPSHIQSSSNRVNNLNRFNKKSTQKRQQTIIIHGVPEVQSMYNQSQQMRKNRMNQQISNQKNSRVVKHKNIKSPDWLKSRRKDPFIQNLTNPKSEDITKPQHEIQSYTTLNTNDMARLRSETTNNLRISQDYNNGGRYLKQKIIQPPKFIQNHQCPQIKNIKLEEQIKQLKFRLQSFEDDNNILLGRMQTLQAELTFNKKKLVQYISREQYHRNYQAKLKEKIQDLQGKLIIAKDQMNSKNQILEIGLNQVFAYNFDNQRQIIQKKNQQISRLNDIINKIRNKVKELNSLLSQQRINSLHHIKSIEQKYEQILLKQQYQMSQLKKQMQFRRLKASNFLSHEQIYSLPQIHQSLPQVQPKLNHQFNYMTQKVITENYTSRKSDQETLKKVVSLNSLHKEVTSNKFRN